MKDTSHSIMRAAKSFFTGTLLSRISGLARDMAMAYVFGTHEGVAAFFLAFRFSHLFRRILGEGAMQNAFVPHFEEMRKDDPRKAGAFFVEVMFSLILVLLLVVGASWTLIGGTLLEVDLSEGNREILHLTLIMMPSLFFICLYGIQAGFLQCEQKYFIPSIAPVAFNGIWILGVVGIWLFSPEDPMTWLAGVVVAACAAQWLATVPASYMQWKTLSCGWKLRVPARFSPEIRSLAAPFLLGAVGIGAAQINSALDAVFARYADLEGPAFLWYAMRLYQVPLALFGIAISSALLPPLCRAAREGHTARFHEFLSFAIRKTVLLMAPITLAMFLFGYWSIALLFGRGEFIEGSIMHTTHCLWAYGVGLLPTSLVLIITPAFYARGDFSTPARGSVVSVGTNILLNFVFIHGLKLGAPSVALSTSFSACVNLAFLVYGLGSLTASPASVNAPAPERARAPARILRSD